VHPHKLILFGTHLSVGGCQLKKKRLLYFFDIHRSHSLSYKHIYFYSTLHTLAKPIDIHIVHTYKTTPTYTASIYALQLRTQAIYTCVHSFIHIHSALYTLTYRIYPYICPTCNSRIWKIRALFVLPPPLPHIHIRILHMHSYILIHISRIQSMSM
jgi:hypothetical protein